MLGAAKAKILLGAALEKNMLGSVLDKKLCLERRETKSYAWSGVR